MEIQQKEKESLTAYIHHFKRELADANLIMMLQLSESSKKGLKMHTL